jgi:hypothetical protein
MYKGKCGSERIAGEDMGMLILTPGRCRLKGMKDDHGKRLPIMRLHLWLETEEGFFFGMGRAQLLAMIAKHGSLRRAAEELCMSCRAA